MFTMEIKKFLQSGVVLVAAVMIINLLNFALSAVLGRFLTFENFGTYTVINSIYYLASIIFMALAATVNHWVAFLSTREGAGAGRSFFYGLRKNIIIISLISAVVWVLFSPFLKSFINLHTIFPLIYFTPIFLVGPYLFLARGYLEGMFLFLFASIVIISEVVSKLFYAVIIFGSHGVNNMAIIIPLSVLTSWLVAIYLCKHDGKKALKKTFQFPRKFFFAALISYFASTASLSVDVIIVKHFMSPSAAGQYSLLSLIGKMIYFFGSIANVLLINYISKYEAQGKSVNKIFNLFFLISLVLTIIIFIPLGLFGNFFVPIFFGARTVVLFPYLISYGIGISLFSLTTTIISYHLILHEYFYVLIALLLIVLIVFGVSMFHKNISQIVEVIFFINISCFALVSAMHLLHKVEKVSRARLIVTE